MKLLFILSLSCLASGNPIVPAAKLPIIFPIGPDDLILHEIASIALNATESINGLPAPDAPKGNNNGNLEPFNHSQLSCVTEDVRHWMRICYNRVMDAIVLSRLFTDCQCVDSFENKKSNRSDETLTSKSVSSTQLPLPVIVECFLNGLEAVDIAHGRINLTIVKQRVINSTALSTSDTSLANAKFDDCIFSNLSLTELDFGIRKTALPDSILKFHMLGMKTMVCAALALMNNNSCATQFRPNSFSRSMQTSTNFPEMTLIAETSIMVTPPSTEDTSPGSTAERR